MVDLFRYRHWDLVSKRWVYFILSGLMLLVGISALFANKAKTGAALNYGIDFIGGGRVTYQLTGTLPADKHPEVIGAIRTQLEEEGLATEVQVSPGSVGLDGKRNPDVLIVRTLLKDIPETEKDAYLGQQIEKNITPTITSVLADHQAELAPDQPESQDVVTGTVSAELMRNGIVALVLGSILILGWIWLRYNIAGFGWHYSAAAIIAVLHDIGTLVGVFAILHNYLQVNSPFIAALLTVLGYSVHDTIVIFDRIRENARLKKGRTFAETVNISLLETLARSVNTVLTTLFVLLALFFFGGPTLRDFTAAMLIGIVLGAYSSIFVAGQLVVAWAKKKDRNMPVEGEAVPVAAVATPQPVAVSASAAPIATPELPTADRDDAVKRARQAGKTSKRKR